MKNLDKIQNALPLGTYMGKATKTFKLVSVHPIARLTCNIVHLDGVDVDVIIKPDDILVIEPGDLIMFHVVDMQQQNGTVVRIAKLTNQ